MFRNKYDKNLLLSTSVVKSKENERATNKEKNEE